MIAVDVRFETLHILRTSPHEIHYLLVYIYISCSDAGRGLLLLLNHGVSIKMQLLLSSHPPPYPTIAVIVRENGVEYETTV